MALLFLNEKPHFSVFSGKNVLGQKSELKKVMDKFQDDQKKKELEMAKLSKRTSLEKRLEEQAQKLKMVIVNNCLFYPLCNVSSSRIAYLLFRLFRQ